MYYPISSCWNWNTEFKQLRKSHMAMSGGILEFDPRAYSWSPYLSGIQSAMLIKWLRDKKEYTLESNIPGFNLLIL